MKKKPDLNIMLFYNQTYFDLNDANHARKGSIKFPLDSYIKIKEDFSNKKRVPTLHLSMSVTKVEDYVSKL